MPIEIVVAGNDKTVKTQRIILAERVVSALPGALPDQKLLCFFDDNDCLLLKRHVGAANRGLYMPIVNGHPLWMLLPDVVRRYVLFGNGSVHSTERIRTFDHLVYLHGSTCSNEIGMTMTFADELQHFIQHETARALWAASTLAIQMLQSLDMVAINTLGLQWCDIPIEREARIVAKRIAERLFGPESVEQYIDAKRNQAVTEQDAADWTCIRGLDLAAQYDLDAETRRFFPRLRDYAPQMGTLLQQLRRKEGGLADLDIDALLGVGGG